MQLAISALGNKASGFIVEILSALSACQCTVIELRTANLTQLSSAYLLISGNWNHIAKLEGMLDAVKLRFNLQISYLRPEDGKSEIEGVPYTLETISVDKDDVLFAVSAFLLERGITIEEVSASRHQAPFFNNPVLSSRFVLLVPPDVRILSLREEFLDFCDTLNIDAILEPIKR
ncbi:MULTISPECIES: ACT domain-containing protein [Methylomonas]|uniref:Glycine cleavage system transcriptional repressor n=1 Tax=Methylomonas koyamae TaxID=702114 RepID=A0A177NHA7_9GAMM|nr:MULTISPECIES: ACT domain-containing protein [Methylomonas]NJA06948.1 transcriptional regulator [Methylococcaceae bacterium WWC4]OAI17242.1 transcriptional regulator [Methylomonas koyamae]WGS83789.1 ACT domain-containing protein [Methylomonas sp. UP202]